MSSPRFLPAEFWLTVESKKQGSSGSKSHNHADTMGHCYQLNTSRNISSTCVSLLCPGQDIRFTVTHQKLTWKHMCLLYCAWKLAIKSTLWPTILWTQYCCSSERWPGRWWTSRKYHDILCNWNFIQSASQQDKQLVSKRRFVEFAAQLASSAQSIQTQYNTAVRKLRYLCNIQS